MAHQEINVVAQQTLDIVTDIALKAQNELAQQDYDTPGVIANGITDNASLRLARSSDLTAQNSVLLKTEPTFMRVDLEDVDGNYWRSFYICKGAPLLAGLSRWNTDNIFFVSQRSPKGRIAALECGDDTESLFDDEYYVANKVRFKPKENQSIWDCLGFEAFNKNDPKPLYLNSVREFLENLHDKGVDVDALLEQIYEQEQTMEGQLKSLTRNIRSGMSLRNQAELDKYQDSIFRLPINSQRIILGPPGTGKTTTLIKRLGQKLDSSQGVLSSEEVGFLRKLGKDGQGFNDWLMFTPSDLLKEYLYKAFNYEGIAIRDNLVTWSAYARDIARKNFSILKSPTNSSGFSVMPTENIKQQYIDDPRLLYSSFQSFIENSLNLELNNGFKILQQASGLNDEKLIERIRSIIESEDAIGSKYRQLFELENQIKKLIENEKNISDKLIQKERNLLINKHAGILEELASFLNRLKQTDDDEDDEESDYDEDESEVTVSHTQQAKALVEYQKFLKKVARYRYLKKSLKKDSKDAKLVEWFSEKMPSDELLMQLGRSIALQNGLRHNLNCWKRSYKKPVAIYKKFRKEEGYQHFYATTKLDLKRISQSELDLILLVILRNIKALLKESYIVRNIDEIAFQELKNLRNHLFKDQIMVDEATDFSALQLACMQAMATPLLNSFFACGDFNQRLTQQGIKDLSLLEWISPELKIERINTIYRQSPKLNAFTHAVLDLMEESDTAARSELPKHVAFEGLAPVLAEYLDNEDDLALWITKRIGEIEHLVNTHHTEEQVLPSIVVLVKDEQDVQPMAKKLTEYLDDYNLKAIACLQGQTVGNANDVRVCSIEYIKGLEFEAVFFVGIDQLIQQYSDLYQKFLYVGATRAANYLGVTCTSELPEEIESLREYFIENWDLESLVL